MAEKPKSFMEWVAAIDRGDAAETLEMRRLWQQGLLNPAQEQIAMDMAAEGKIPPRDAPIDESEMSPVMTTMPGQGPSDEERMRIAAALREDPYGHLESHDYGGTVQIQGLPPSRIRGDITAGAGVWAEPGQREWEITNRGDKVSDYPTVEPPRGVTIKPPADTETRRFGNAESGMTSTGQFEREFGAPGDPLTMPEDSGFKEGPGTVNTDIWSMTPEERLQYRMARIKALTKADPGANIAPLSRAPIPSRR